MKLVFILQSIYRIGGTEKATIDQANLISDSTNNEVHIISLYQEVESEHRVNHYISDKIKVHFLHKKIVLLKYSDTIYNLVDLIYKKKTVSLIKSLNPTLCIFTSVKLMTASLPCPAILMAHFRFSHFISGKVTRFYLDKYHKLFERVIFLTEEDMRSYQSHYKSGNGEYIFNYCHVTARMKSDFSNKRIAYIGRIDDSQKQLSHALEIIAGLIRDNVFNGWRFDLYGTGNDVELIKNKIKSLELCDSVNFMGKYNSLDSVLEKTDLLILTSRFEGLPLSLIEGALSGIPLISYNCSPGISDIIENGYNGFIIEQDNKDEFRARVSELILNNEKLKKFGENSFSLAQRKFSKEVILQKWNSVLVSCELISKDKGKHR